MVKYASLLVLFVCFLIIISCAAKQSFITLKPEQEEATPLVYSNVPSFINVPVSIKLKDIENQTNAILTGLIYEDKNIEDDDIEIKIWKQAPIIIQNENALGIFLFTFQNFV